MHKAARVTVADGVGNLARGKRGGERHGAAGERFPQAQNIRRDPRMLAGKQLPGTAKAGGDLIGNQQNSFAVAHLPNALQPLGVIDPHSARALHNRFENNGGNLVAMGRHQPREAHHVHLVPFAVEAALRGWRKQVFRQVAFPQAVHGVVRIAHRHRPEGVAVIAVAEGEEPLARFALRMPVLQRHFHRYFHGHRAGVGQENTLQRFRRHRYQATA